MIRIGFIILPVLLLLFSQLVSAGDKVLTPLSVERIEAKGTNSFNRCFYSSRCNRNLLGLERDKPWGLPKLSADAPEVDTIRILAMRFDFIEEIPDDPNTTGRGVFDMRDPDSFFVDEGFLIDHSPHNRLYFEKHLEALSNYYTYVSDSALVLQWDVYPRNLNSAYHLPKRMARYGSGTLYSEIIARLVDTFTVDCFQLVDTVEPGINFSRYDSYFLFHAGSDRQNDNGFPLTPNDLFTGYITRGDDLDSLCVDGDFLITDALIIPETCSQDNRATALNATIAHEFGHQLGLVDLYNTYYASSVVGDFALMDNMGNGTGIDFGFPRVGRVFGSIPVYPMAWSRAYLGFEEPVTFRQNAEIELVACEMLKEGIKVARIPITEYEYYLIENRQEDIDGRLTSARADSATTVILGPIYFNPIDSSKEYTGEYDFCLPGSGIVIWHVDEQVATIKKPGSEYTLFELNQLQWDFNRRFIELVEADGIVHFQETFNSGVGYQQDMFYEGNNNSFTPNTNPAAIGYTGASSRAYITDISVPDTTMSFKLEFDLFSDGFPRRVGYPNWGLSPVADDIDGDGLTEIITVSGENILVMKEDGSDFLNLAITYYDTAFSSIGELAEPIPFFASPGKPILAGPVVGNFGSDENYISVSAGDTADGYRTYVYKLEDADSDGQADLLFGTPHYFPGGVTVWESFGEDLTVAVWYPGHGILFSIDESGNPTSYPQIAEELPYGLARVGGSFIAIGGDTLETYVKLYSVTQDTAISFDPEGFFYYGPVVADLNRDSLPEVIIATPDGAIKTISLDTSSVPYAFSITAETNLGNSIYANPVVADIDNDGYADIIIGGQNKIFGLNRDLNAILDFPITIDDYYPEAVVVSAPIVADINNDGLQDVIVITSAGNCYAYGPELLYGFPVAVGGVGLSKVLLNGVSHDSTEFLNLEVNGIGSPLLYEKTNGGGIAFLSGDGWFNSYDVSYNSELADWPMNGGNPQGSFSLPVEKLGDVVEFATDLPKERFFCYPNPTLDGVTRIRYFLGREARRVSLNFYDMSGKRVDEYTGLAGLNSGTKEYTWNGSGLPGGVYRCIIKVDFDGSTETAFTDIAIIK